MGISVAIFHMLFFRGRNTQKREVHRSTWLVRRKDTWPNLSKSGNFFSTNILYI